MRPQFQKTDEYKDHVLEINRVTRVTKGGKRMRFRTVVVIGNQKGKVGIGVAKGPDVVESISKAKNKAKKNVFTINMDGKTIPHPIEMKYSAARIVIKPAEVGHGLMAGGAARIVLSMAGFADVTAKYLSRTTNKLANAMVTLEALKQLKPSKNQNGKIKVENDNAKSKDESDKKRSKDLTDSKL